MSLNPRLNNIVHKKGDHYIWITLKRTVRLPDVETANRILDRIDFVSRGPVSDRTLIWGIKDRRDDRSYEQKLADEAKTYRSEDYPDTWWSPSPDNPYAQAIKDLDASRPQRKTIRDQVREHYQQQAEEWEEQQSAPAAEPPKLDWKRLVLGAELFLVAEYTNVPVTTYQQTLAMLDAVEAKDSKAFAALHKEFAAAAESRYAAADSELAAEQARIAAAREWLGEADFDFPTTGEQSAAGSNTQQEETT